MDEAHSQIARETLDPQAFEALLALLGEDRLAASHKYELLRQKLVYFFRNRECIDAEALADICLDRLARRISEGTEVLELKNYCLGIARIVLLETRRKDSRNSDAIRELSYQWHIARNTSHDHEELLLGVMRDCLQRVSAIQQELLARYYCADGRSRIDQRRRLAQELQISSTALRNRALRARESLEASVRAHLHLRSHGTRDVRRKSDTH